MMWTPLVIHIEKKQNKLYKNPCCEQALYLPPNVVGQSLELNHADQSTARQMVSPTPSITPHYKTQIGNLQTCLPITNEKEVQDYPAKDQEVCKCTVEGIKTC